MHLHNPLLAAVPNPEPFDAPVFETTQWLPPADPPGRQVAPSASDPLGLTASLWFREPHQTGFVIGSDSVDERDSVPSLVFHGGEARGLGDLRIRTERH
jgi:hypothetical protein